MSDYQPLQLIPASESTLRLLQLTDPHLYRDPDRTLMGISTEQSLHQCLQLAKQKHWPSDLVLMTGDLAHDESEEAYRRLKDILAKETSHTAVLPGNHDTPETIRKVFNSNNSYSGGCIETQHWQIILLNSHKPGSEAGLLSDNELLHLETCLLNRKATHTLIALHHPPIAVNSRWLDTMQLENSKDFWEIIYRFQNIQGILYGHIHQEYDQKIKNIHLLATPSTCIQFKPESETFALDPVPPGYRWLELHSNGKIKTGVERIKEMPEGLDTHSHGY